MLKNPFKRKAVPIPEQKSYSYIPNLFEYLSSTGWGQVTAWQSLRYYEQVAPIAIAVDKVVDEFKSIKPVIYDSVDQDYITEHPFLAFLQAPNATTSMQDFFKNYGTYYKVVGEAYLMGTGNPNRPPLELSVIPPQFVSIDMNMNDGMPESYSVNDGASAITFTRKEVDGRARYYNNDDRELWHVKDFNPNASNTNFNGASVLNSIYYEIEQYLSGSEHNLALLKNGGRLTGALSADEVLGDDAYQRLKQEVNETIVGARNAGRVPFFDGGIKWIEYGKSNKDMDFATLMQTKTEIIFMRLNIPLPIVTVSASTLNNLGVAQVSLYDNAVLPLTSKLFEELTLFLGPRFGLSENESLSVDLSTIPALQTRRLDNLTQQNKLYILSDNEQRAMLNREERDGGDSIYKPANLIADGEDSNDTGNREEPTRQKFINIMTEQKDSKGIRLYSDMEIKVFADEEGL
jgi:HK97 family phage portal protein